MVQTCQGFRSKKPKQPQSPEVRKECKADRIKSQVVGSGYGTNRGVEKLPKVDEPTPGNYSVIELYVRVLHKQILYTDDTGRFPIRVRSGNQYVMVAYCSSNVILVEPFSSRKDKNRLAAYNSIMQRPNENNLLVYLQVLDNECIQKYQETMRDRWGVKFQLVPPDMHI